MMWKPKDITIKSNVIIYKNDAEKEIVESSKEIFEMMENIKPSKNKKRSMVLFNTIKIK